MSSSLTALTGFLVFLAVTLALLGVVVVTGFQAKRRLHLPAVALAVASLGVTIYYAEQLGRSYDLEAAGAIYPIHLTIAKIATVSYLLPIITGIRTLKNPSRKRTHRMVAFLVLGLTVLTACTGTAMVLMAEPLPTP